MNEQMQIYVSHEIYKGSYLSQITKSLVQVPLYLWKRYFPSESSSSFIAERNMHEAPSRAAAICSDIFIPSFMAFRRPPPSPLRAGPRHSGRLISRRTTKLAFSSTVSPKLKKNGPHQHTVIFLLLFSR